MASESDTPASRSEEIIEWLQAQRVLASYQKVLLLRLLGPGDTGLACCIPRK